MIADVEIVGQVIFNEDILIDDVVRFKPAITLRNEVTQVLNITCCRRVVNTKIHFVSQSLHDSQ